MQFVPTIDSTIKLSPKIPNSTSTSLFSNHLLKPSSDQPDWKAPNTDYWIPGILFFCFVVYVYLKTQYRKKINEVFNVFFSNRTLNKLSREDYALNNRLSLGMMLVFILTSSLFLYELNDRYKWMKTIYGYEFWTYVKIILIVSGLFFSKIFMVRMLGMIFNRSHEAEEQIFNIFLFNKVLGLFLFPIVIGIVFIDAHYKNLFIYSVPILLSLIFIYRILRSFSSYITDSNFSKLYLFMYLCALEIIPLVVIIKLFII